MSSPYSCHACGKDCAAAHCMCDQSAGPDDRWCPECFDETPCGKGEHGEGCPTMVFELEEGEPRTA